MFGRQLVVVLGVHRSGTSVCTRSLYVFGFDLGKSLMPPETANNDKGFWEDLDIVALNDEMLAACSRKWYSLLPLTACDIDQLVEQGFLDKASQLLESKLSAPNNFAFKDPRLSKLLPLWESALQALNADVRYLYVVRNPLSVAASLRARDAFPLAKSLLLWCSDALSFLESIGNTQVLFVSYERLMQDPQAELQRMGHWLQRQPDPDELQSYLVRAE
jgi:O-antigen biosynthesis protein